MHDYFGSHLMAKIQGLILRESGVQANFLTKNMLLFLCNWFKSMSDLKELLDIFKEV